MSKFYLLLFALLACMPLQSWLSPLAERSNVLKWTWRIVLSIAILVLSVALLVGATNNPFLYTRF